MATTPLSPRHHLKVAIILGTRPEIIKLSPLIRQLPKSQLDFFVIHSNQHYSPEMDSIFFQELKLPQPQYHLNVGSGSHAQMTAKILTGVEQILLDEKPNWVMVQGDTNTVLAGALAAAKLQIKVAHLEAGLRSYDRSMPEELNRILTDHLSHLLFAPTINQQQILLGEGIDPTKIVVTGNTIVDAVFENIKLAPPAPASPYLLLTLHRPSNVDSPATLKPLIEALTSVSQETHLPFIFPIHPRTQKNLQSFGLNLDPHVFHLTPPVGYLEMLSLEKSAQLIFTDSGGIQEEACILGTPSITLRDNTERPETLEVGASILASAATLLEATQKMLSAPRHWPNPFGNGHSTSQIITSLLSR